MTNPILIADMVTNESRMLIVMMMIITKKNFKDCEEKNLKNKQT